MGQKTDPTGRRARSRAIPLLVLIALGAGCDWPEPPDRTAPALVAWEAESGAAVALPVAGEVIDPFRAPAHAYGPGNRGIEYRTDPGNPVRAAGPGRVSFAGSVADRLVVAIDHADDRRTTYTGLAAVAVAVGDRVERGDGIGTAGGVLHFGLKVGGAYADPAPMTRSASAVLLPLE